MHNNQPPTTRQSVAEHHSVRHDYNHCINFPRFLNITKQTVGNWLLARAHCPWYQNALLINRLSSSPITQYKRLSSLAQNPNTDLLQHGNFASYFTNCFSLQLHNTQYTKHHLSPRMGVRQTSQPNSITYIGAVGAQADQLSARGAGVPDLPGEGCCGAWRRPGLRPPPTLLSPSPFP